ncbi:MAG: hypothetical protein KTR32_04310 [Granulosicoccus sp.]|nr:hypothetical protein [Granulosicoccus sp.]
MSAVPESIGKIAPLQVLLTATDQVDTWTNTPEGLEAVRVHSGSFRY